MVTNVSGASATAFLSSGAKHGVEEVGAFRLHRSWSRRAELPIVIVLRAVGG